MTRIPEWNVVASVREPYFSQARDLLGHLGEVSNTDYYNVLALRVDDIDAMLDTLSRQCLDDPRILDWFGHVVPATVTFAFQSPAEFDTHAREALLSEANRLADTTFFVRVERRGFKGRLDAGREERLLGKIVLEALAARGAIAHVGFEDPDVIVMIETVGQRAGLSLWTREQRLRYPFLRLE